MTFLQSLIDGIGLGAVYAVVGVGIGLVFGVMRLVNFAYGELITAGGYTLALLSSAPGIVAIVVCFAVVVALALVAGADRVPAAARRRAGDDADHDVRGQLPAAERLPARLRLARQHRRHARRPQQRDRHRLAADPLDHDRRRDRRRSSCSAA